MAADAHVQIDDQRQLLRVRRLLHRSAFLSAGEIRQHAARFTASSARGHLRKGLRGFISRAGRSRTRTSYQPAWPVMGSELLMRCSGSPAGCGSSSLIR